MISKIKEGKESLKSFCDASGYTYNEKLIDKILENERKLQEELNLATKNVFRYKRVRMVLLKLSIAWFAASMVYYGIMFSPIPNGVLLNNIILGVLSTIAGPIMILVMQTRFANRRSLMAGMYLIAGLAVLAMAFMALSKNDILMMVFGSLSYGVVCGAFSLLFLYTSELLPTVIRCAGFGCLSAFGRIGSILGSQILKLNTDEAPWVSGVVFGIVTLIAAGLIYTLPETRGKPLTQTLDEAEVAFGKVVNFSTEEKKPSSA